MAKYLEFIKLFFNLFFKIIKLNIDESSHAPTTPTSKTAEHTDFFSEASFDTNAASLSNITPLEIKEPQIVDKSHEGPNVLAALAKANEGDDGGQVKSAILQKKPVQTKKKGLGAQKVNTDFKEIERAMLEQEKTKEIELQQQAKNKEEQEKQMEKQMASMKLAYNNLDKQREKEEAKLMQSDPKKAQQLERLGMAAGTRSVGISHSAVSDMQIIQQEGSSNNSKSNYSQPKRDFFDEMESHFTSSKSNNGYGRDNDDDNGGFKGFGSCNYVLFLFKTES